MPRKARLIVPGAFYHVMARCVDQYKLFSCDNDRHRFLSLLAEYLKATATRCYAWCLMDNHFHLLLRINDIELWEILKPLNMRYAQYHKVQTGRRGPLFMDRFKSIAVQDQNYVRELVRYVHLNPIRAGICKNLGSLDRYPWCGHSALMGNESRSFQDTKTVLKRFGPNVREARAAYCTFLKEGLAEHTNPLIELVRKSNKGSESGEKPSCWVIGDHEFVAKAIASSDRRRLRMSHFERAGRKFDDIFRVIKRQMRVDENMISERHRGGSVSDARKVFAYLASRKYRAPVHTISQILNVGISAVSHLSKKGRDIVQDRKIAF